MPSRCAAGGHLGGELALDRMAVAHRQRRLVVGQLLEAGEAVIPIGGIVRAPGVTPIACGRVQLSVSSHTLRRQVSC